MGFLKNYISVKFKSVLLNILSNQKYFKMFQLHVNNYHKMSLQD